MHPAVNLWRLHVVPDPDLAPHREAFDELLAATPPGGEIAYELPAPKWWFLHHLVRQGYLLHGSNAGAIEEFEPRPNFDAHNVDHVHAVFATDDAIWPLYFAVVDRSNVRGLINWCEHVPGASRYLFSIEGDPLEPRSWTDGTIYVLPAETFERTPGSRELVSRVPVRPRARLPVTPRDFPLRERTTGHRRGDTPRRVTLRNALRMPSRR